MSHSVTDTKLILEGIASRRCLEVTYNRMQMKLAPHVLYTRHGDLFLDAVAVERDGREAREPKLGTFKLAGLRDVNLVATPFDPIAGFDGKDEKYWEVTPFAVA
jgi:hypothetical protein